MPLEYKYCVRKYRLETGVGRKRVVRLAFLTDIHLTDQGRDRSSGSFWTNADLRVCFWAAILWWQKRAPR